MTQFPLAEKTLTVSVTGQEPVEIKLDGTESFTLRLEMQGANFTYPPTTRPGSYTDMEPPFSRH
jgi:hypothetical protein